MMDYTDINFYLNKAKGNILDAIRCVKTMENIMSNNSEYKMLIDDLDYITEIIDKSSNTSDEVADTFERKVKKNDKSV